MKTITLLALLLPFCSVAALGPNTMKDDIPGTNTVKDIVTAGAGDLATKAELAAHTSSSNNPHGVTAAQAGAYSTAEADARFAFKSNITEVVDNLTETNADKALSANMGRELQTEIERIQSRGRYLSLWNSATGLPFTNPTISPYAYKTGDYFIVGTVTTNANYRPTGSAYTNGVASVQTETDSVLVNDTYYFDGSAWLLVQAEQKEVSFAVLSGSPYDNTNLKNALDAGVAYTTAVSNKLTNTKQDTLNQSQTNAINSGITSDRVSTYDGYATGKQNAIADLATIRSGAEAGATAVQPSAITNMATKTWVGNQGYETATNAAATYQTKIGDLATIRSGAASGATAVQPSAITDMATKTWVGQQGYETSAHASATYQPKGDYLTNHQSLEPATNYANRVAVSATNYANTAAAGAVVAATNAAAAMANAAETSAVAKAANMTNDAHIVRGNIAGNVWDITVDQSVRSGTATLAENIPWTGVKGTPTTLSGYGITDAYTKTEADGEFVNAQTATNIVKDATNALATVAHTGSYEDLNNRPDIPSTNGFIYAEGATNAAEAVVAQVLDYALTNLTAASLALASGEIGNYTTAADFTLALDFAENGRSGDCLLYVANTDAAADHTITLTPNTYTFVSADIAKARTLTKATTNIVSFTRLTATTVLVSKLEVK